MQILALVVNPSGMTVEKIFSFVTTIGVSSTEGTSMAPLLTFVLVRLLAADRSPFARSTAILATDRKSTPLNSRPHIILYAAIPFQKQIPLPNHPLTLTLYSHP